MSNVGFRGNSPEAQKSIDDFTGLGSVKRRLRKVEERVGLTNKVPPAIVGSTDSEKLASLINTLKDLGIVK